jgi:hypothetical protein
VQLRWQRLARELTAEDGPSAEVLPVSELPDRLPYYQEARCSQAEYAARIAARQTAVAERMLG